MAEHEKGPAGKQVSFEKPVPFSAMRGKSMNDVNDSNLHGRVFHQGGMDDTFIEAVAQTKTALLLRGATTSNLLDSPAPAAASDFDVLFGRCASTDMFKAESSKAASAFDVFFGGSATVVDVGPNAPRIPSPSGPIDVLPSVCPSDVVKNAVMFKSDHRVEDGVPAFVRSRSRPETLQDLVIPSKKLADPSDEPQHMDRFSPTTLLEQSGMEEASRSAPMPA
eukprot:CAMPEP_0181322878 /NCGR_PEP_ID=MMETSP1101-20121128/19470_1 /TAXON_ID=46948 /ORGANISM="Rhodomonas abbreviata, Strain Caron Lab Isolate" /LENGTH=221 /DNA_ID=CAMNT_0023430835 /DNA_START=101 /DNA_END=766 /DNA_ORIENTATION=+